MKLCAFLLLSIVAMQLTSAAFAQSSDQLGCPGQWVPNGRGGTGCQCPDGSFASARDVGGFWQAYCPTAQPQYQPTPTPIGSCGSWNCPLGTHCSLKTYGVCLAAGDTECASGGICSAGYQCNSRSTKCIPVDNAECGDSSCRPGYYCGSRNACIAEGDIDCGNGGSCPSDKKCSRDLKHCIPTDIVDCGDHFCNPGRKCGSGTQCLASDSVDCGKGKSCTAGYVCRKGGGCATREELAAEYAAEQKRKKEEAEKKEEERKRKIAEQKAKDEAKRQTKAEQNAASKFAKITSGSASQTKMTGRQASDTLDYKLFETYLNDPKQPPVARRLAGAVLGKDVPEIQVAAPTNGASLALRPPVPFQTTQSDRTFAITTLSSGKTPLVSRQTISQDDQFRAMMNNPNVPLATRRVAAVALGEDPAAIVQSRYPGGQSSTGARLNSNLKDIATLRPPPSSTTLPVVEPQPKALQKPPTTFTSNPSITAPNAGSKVGRPTLEASVHIDDKGKTSGSLALSISKSETVSVIGSNSKVGDVAGNLNVGTARGTVTASLGLKSVSLDVSTGATVLHSDMSYGGYTLSNDVGSAQAGATASLHPAGAAVEVGASVSVVNNRITKKMQVGEYQIDIYAEGGVGIGAHADLDLSATGVKIGGRAGAGPSVGLGVEISR